MFALSFVWLGCFLNDFETRGIAELKSLEKRMDHVAELGVMWRRKKVMSGWKYGWLVIGLFCLALAAGAA